MRANVLDKQSKAVQALLGGWFAAIDYLKREPHDAARRMGVRQQASAEQFLESLKGLHIPSREENLKMLGGPAPTLAATGARLMDLMIEGKLLSARVNLEEILAPAPLASLPR